jgi:exopolysaccharide biosynthesis polyprenyl glycosylphosphotransferase
MDRFARLFTEKIIPFIKKWNLLNTILRIGDILAITIAFQLAYFINYIHIGDFFFTNLPILLIYLIVTPFWLMVLYLIDAIEIPRSKRYITLFLEYLQATLLIVVLILVYYFVFKLYKISRLFLIEVSVFGSLFLFITRITEYKLFKIYRSKGYNFLNTVLIADETSTPFIESLLANKEWGYRIILIYTNSQAIIKKYQGSIEVLPEKSGKSLYDFMEIEPIDEVLYIRGKIIPSDIRNIIRSCEELGVVFRLMHDDSRLNLTNAVHTTIGNKNFLTFINVPYRPAALAFKKVTDIFFSFLGLIILSPVLLLIAIAIKLTSKGPVLYRQARVGLRGRPFYLYKFRTMVSGAESLRKDLLLQNEMDGPVFKIKDDPRITNVGKFLRRTGLDELPQLANVLKGEMSLIGPRPPLQEETVRYKRWQLRRLSVKPGLSCFWQIKPERNNIKFEKWMEMDLAYIDNWSLRLDFIILVKTIKTIFHRSGL